MIDRRPRVPIPPQDQMNLRADILPDPHGADVTVAIRTLRLPRQLDDDEWAEFYMFAAFICIGRWFTEQGWNVAEMAADLQRKDWMPNDE